MRRTTSDNPIPYIISGVAVLAAVVGGIAYAINEQPTQRTASKPTNKSVIRDWLKENLHDADFEEVKWFTPVEATDIRIYNEEHDSEGTKRRRYNDGLVWQKSVGGTLVRLRYRARVPAGGKMLFDETFNVMPGDKGGVIWWQHPSENVLVATGSQSRLMTD